MIAGDRLSKLFRSSFAREEKSEDTKVSISKKWIEQFDSKRKPSSELNTFSTKHFDIEEPPAGLPNIGNTCFM